VPWNGDTARGIAPTSARRLRRKRRGGFTLIEAVVSAMTLAALMIGMASVMLLASRSLRSAAGDVAEAGDATADIVADLNLAQSLTEQTVTAVTMVVPDRDGDGLPETIRYAWSGTAGDPLTREYNGGDATTVVENVHEFDLEYITRTVGGG